MRGEADAEHRNANFVAVGVLVPLSGALGRVWEHAETLRGLAKGVMGNAEDTEALEAFWEKNQLESTAAAGDSKKRKRGESEATLPAFNLENAWPREHPALAVPDVMDLFGPLLFPLQRAVLARKRILFLGSAPVRGNALVVWLASVLGNVSRDVGGGLDADLLKTIPLFSVGIHDITTLPGRREGKGWLACTTDDILGEKKDLWDVLVKLPAQSQNRSWPTLTTSDGRIIKASQRDSRRWTLLQRELRRIRFQICGRYADDLGAESPDEDDQRPLLERRRTSEDADDPALQPRDDGEAVEPPTWTAVAYRGFMWWASAGEASAWEEDEVKADEELLFDPPDMGSLSPTVDRKASAEREAEYARAVAIVLVAYFRRVTERILGTMTSIVEEADDDTEEGIQDDEVQIAGDDLRQMGLDRWSEADRTFFVQDMMEKWFERKAVVADDGLTLCGVRLC